MSLKIANAPITVTVSNDEALWDMIPRMIAMARAYRCEVRTHYNGVPVMVTAQSIATDVLTAYQAQVTHAQRKPRKPRSPDGTVRTRRPTNKMSQCNRDVTQAQVDRAVKTCIGQIARLYQITEAESALFTGAVKNGRGLDADQIAKVKARLQNPAENWLYLRAVNDAISRANTAAAGLKRYSAPGK